VSEFQSSVIPTPDPAYPLRNCGITGLVATGQMCESIETECYNFAFLIGFEKRAVFCPFCLPEFFAKNAILYTHYD
jgi:hypothetical protein